MRKIICIITVLLSLHTAAQNIVSRERVNTASLTVLSIDTSSVNTDVISDAIPLIGTVYSVPQYSAEILIPINKSNNQPAPPTIKNEAISLPNITYTTSQASNLKLIPINTNNKK